MSTLYPKLPGAAAKEIYCELQGKEVGDVTKRCDTSHPAQYFAATGGTRVTSQQLEQLRAVVVGLAGEYRFPSQPLGRRSVQSFDTDLATALHTRTDLVPAEAAVRQVWAFLALVVLPDVAVWRFPEMSEDRFLATDITRHVFGRLWWRAETLRDEHRKDEPYHLLDVFPERNFDQILSRRKSIGGSPELIRALAKEWPRPWSGPNEANVLRDVLKRLMRLGAFQDLFGLPEHLLRNEVARTISAVRYEPLAAGDHRGPEDLDDE